MPQSDTSPAENAAEIDYSGGDQTIPSYTRGILIGTAGDLKVDMVGVGSGVTLPMPVGLHALRIKKIYQSGSTAAGAVVW